MKSIKIELNRFCLLLICLTCFVYSCDEVAPHSQIDAPIGMLSDRSIGTVGMISQMKLINFGYVTYTEHPPMPTAYSPTDSVVYGIDLADSNLILDSVCKLDDYHRFYSQWLDDCSVLTVDNETGQFTLSAEGAPVRQWKFERYAPQVIPNRAMKIVDNWVYILNSSYTHDVRTLGGARAFYQEVRPILMFNVGDPTNSVRSVGRFPMMYVESEENISDYQPFFCVDDRGRCILSFGYSDSLIVIEEGDTKSEKCKSAYYTEPSFLNFEDAKSLANQRRFYAENARYLGVFFNPIRREYYRYVKHRNRGEAETLFSIIVMDEKFVPLHEWVFESSSFTPFPIICTAKGFLLLNLVLTSQEKKPHFEHFAM